MGNVSEDEVGERGWRADRTIDPQFDLRTALTKKGRRPQASPPFREIRSDLPLVDAEFFQLGCDIRAMGGWFHGRIDIEDLAIFPDVDGGPTGHLAISLGNTIRLRDGSIGVAQDRVIELERLGKFRVCLDVVTARCEMSDIKFPNLTATLTERLAFGRSATGKGFRIPGHYHGLLALEIGECIGFAIASFQGEIRGIVANRKVSASTCREADEPDEEPGGEK